MSDFFEAAKSFVNTTVSRAGWEAQKQQRVISKQKEVDKLVRQRQELMDELGQVAMTLYEQGALTDAQLSRLCASVLELDHDLRTREQQIQDLKAESYPADQFAPEATRDYAPPPVPSGPASPVTPATPGTSQPSQPNRASSTNVSGGYQATAGTNAQNQVRCPQCGSAVRANSAYCRGCGAKLR
jgi:hypothetical protein